jgi:LysR family transcriptional regulator, benzoate and cis,cis-muconate-responsive activator of ben and cat genes
MPREYQFPFTLRHLVYFREVARQLHFRRAAETLAVAQPALSRQIAQLEAAFGAPLFQRSNRRVQLTPAGKWLDQRLDPLLRSLDTLGAELRAVAEGRVGQVRVAFTGLAMATVLPVILRDFHRRHPGIKLELNESPTSAQLAALQAGELGCGFFHPDAPAPGLETRLVLRERNGVLLPREHGLAGRRQLRLRDLKETPFVLFPRAYNPGFYDRIITSFAQAGVAPRIAEEIWPRANGVGLVRAGVGATFLCPSEAQNLPAEVVFRPLRGPAPESRLVIGWRAGAIEPALEAFLDVALTTTRARPGRRRAAPSA